MVGGRNFRESQFNLAAQAQRQPGSAFKPFVLAAALQQGVAPGSTFVSKPISISLGDRIWSRARTTRTRTSARSASTTATTHSDNTVYAQLTEIVGPTAVSDDRRARSGDAASSTRTSRSGSAPRRSTRSSSRAPTRRSRTAGSASTGRSSANVPRAVIRVEQSGTSEEPLENQVGPRSVLRKTTAQTVNSLLQHVVQSGTGQRAALAGPSRRRQDRDDRELRRRVVRRLHAAARRRRLGRLPRHAEADADRVPRRAGRRRHVPRADLEVVRGVGAAAARRAAGVVLARRRSSSGTTKRVIRRDGRLLLDNGLCRGALSIVYFTSYGPKRTANCKPNEVEVPRVVGQKVDLARIRLAAQPLESVIAYQPAKPLQRVDRVVAQVPATRAALSFDTVTLIVPRPAARRGPEADGPDAPRGALQAPRSSSCGRTSPGSPTARRDGSSRRRPSPGSPRSRAWSSAWS